MVARRAGARDFAFGALAVLAVAATSGLGQLATFPNLSWYAGLSKPSFNPPNWIFGPVWTLLYGLMAFAAWRVMRLPETTRGRSVALSLFFIQLALNAAWSWMFFAANSPFLGAVNIVPQFLIVIATAIVFQRLDPVAGWCLLPLAAWVGFAGVLNFWIWRLNP
jgi:benzodiazapine receptor